MVWPITPPYGDQTGSMPRVLLPFSCRNGSPVGANQLQRRNILRDTGVYSPVEPCDCAERFFPAYALGVTLLLLVYSASGYTQSGSEQDASVASLIRQFRDAGAIPAKERILYRLAQRGGDAGKQLLRLAETTDDADTRWLAIRGLGVMKFTDAAPFLIDSLRSSEHYVRANAARALGEIRLYVCGSFPDQSAENRG